MSTKQILTWLRSHGYTPLEYANLDDECGGSGEDATVEYVSSLTPINRLFPYRVMIGTQSSSSQRRDSDHELEIVGEDVDERRSNQKRSLETKLDGETTFQPEDALNYIEMTPEDKYIRDELFKVRFILNL